MSDLPNNASVLNEKILQAIEAMGPDMVDRLIGALTTVAADDASRCVVMAAVPADMAEFVLTALQHLEEDDGSSIIMVLRRDIYARLTAGESLTLADLTVYDGPSEAP